MSTLCFCRFEMDGRGMIDVSQPVPMSFVFETIGVIFAVIALGIMMVKQAKRRKESV